MFKHCFWLLLILSWQISCAQKDSLVTKNKPFIEQAVLPGTLILTGSLLTGTFTENTIQKNVRDRVGNSYHNGIDDYLQYVSYAEVFIGDALGMNAKNHWFDQTKNMAISITATTLIVHSLKYGIGKTRPDNSSNNSFPSGHTTTAFVGATVLYQEYKDANALMAYNGFLFAGSTGSLRIMNNRHYLSDVLVGAGIGILVVNTVYHFQPLKNWNPFKKNNNVSFCPLYNGDGLTFTAALTF